MQAHPHDFGSGFFASKTRRYPLSRTHRQSIRRTAPTPRTLESTRLLDSFDPVRHFQSSWTGYLEIGLCFRVQHDLSLFLGPKAARIFEPGCSAANIAQGFCRHSVCPQPFSELVFPMACVQFVPHKAIADRPAVCTCRQRGDRPRTTP